jgi:FtsH-binding integral membrane protein
VHSRSTWMAWGLLALGLIGNAAAVAMSVVNGTFGWQRGEVLLWVVFAAFLVVGCLILARRPGNVIGWIFTAVGLLTMTAGLAEGYAKYAYLTHPGSLPGRLAAAWVFTWIWSPTIILTLVFLLLLFPTGRSLSPRWRPLTWLAVGLTAAFAILGALSPSLEVSDNRTVANPIGVEGADIDAAPLGPILNGLLVVLFVGAIAMLVVRFWRSRAWNASSSSGSPTPASWCCWPR